MNSSRSVEVVIVGGGMVGLSTSVLLSTYGIQNILFERHPGTSVYPKAIGLHNRSMEIFRKMGLEAEVNAHAAPPESFRRAAWYTGLGPNDRPIAARDAFGHVDCKSKVADAYRNASPSAYGHLSQLRLEPILKRRAEQLNPHGILFNHEVDNVEEKDDHVLVTWHDRGEGDNSTSTTTRAQYVVGADGGRSLTKQLGLGYTGAHDLFDMITAHIRAPIAQHHPDSDVLISWFVNPELGGTINTGIMYHIGPYPRDPSTDEWSYICARLPHERGQPLSAAAMLARIHATLKVPGLPVELLSVSPWAINAQHAARYATPGLRVFLVGDAAHRVAPFGALGGNTGLQDADNLAWKLALALRQPPAAAGALLATYDAERRPVGARVAHDGLHNMLAMAHIFDRALGVDPAHSPQENVRAMETYFDVADVGEGAQRRARVAEALKTLDLEFSALGAEAGWFYDLSATCDNEEWRSPQVNADGSMETCEFRVTTMPGHQLPHAWLRGHDGVRSSTRWLTRPHKLVLFTSSACWSAAEHELVEMCLIGDGGWEDKDGAWARQREVAPSGAVLARPDNIVVYRWKNGEMLKQHADPSAELARVVTMVLKLAPQTE